MDLYEFAKTIGATVRISGDYDPLTGRAWVNAYLHKNQDCRSHTGWSCFGRSHDGNVHDALRALAANMVEEGAICFDDRNTTFNVPDELTVETCEPFAEPMPATGSLYPAEYFAENQA